MQSISATNDFVVKFANVNGSGSASANELFARSILRMGVPVASRNIFPSNIQGLPTWYEVRVSGEGWQGRRGGVDLMVAMNPQTWDKDVASIEGIRDNQLVGYGLVVGLDGTGDQTSQTPFTVQSIINMLAKYGVTIPPNVKPQLKNVAAVTVTATLAPFARPRIVQPVRQRATSVTSFCV